MTPSPDPESILDTVPVYNSVKADAWDAFHAATGPDDFKTKFDPLPLPHSTKADLWDLKYGQQAESPASDISPSDEAAKPEAELKPEKPPEPNQVQRVSPATPNPPTAALPTTPEQPATIALQMQQLGAGQRKAVMFPRGTAPPVSYPPGTSVTHDAFGNTYAYRPDLIKKSEISRAAAKNRLPEVLGSSDGGMGVPDKSALPAAPQTVTGRAADGTEAQSVATGDLGLPAALEATQKVTPPGGSVSVGPAANVLAERQLPPPVPIAAAIPGNSPVSAAGEKARTQILHAATVRELAKARSIGRKAVKSGLLSPDDVNRAIDSSFTKADLGMPAAF